jgi:6-pyruvoyl-tetrahydropterin synthase
VHGVIDAQGICAGIDFGTLKYVFRSYIDDVWDHHLHLNAHDVWAQRFDLHDPLEDDPVSGHRLPGLITHPADPTTENVARWICEYMWSQLSVTKEVQAISIEIAETSTNGAKWVCAREG